MDCQLNRRTLIAVCVGVIMVASCTNGPKPPLATNKNVAELTPIEPLPCERTIVQASPLYAPSVGQTTLDRWLIELAGSFAGFQQAIARSDLKRANGDVLVHSGELVRYVAKRHLATAAAVLDVQSTLMAPVRFDMVVVRNKTEHVVSVRAGLSPGQSAFQKDAAMLVVAKTAARWQLSRLRYRSLRARQRFARTSAQWRVNGDHGAGLRLVSVRKGWLYYALGLRAHDLIRSVDGTPYGSVGQLQRALYTASLSPTNDEVTVALTRHGRHMSLTYQFVGPSYRPLPSDGCIARAPASIVRR